MKTRPCSNPASRPVKRREFLAWLSGGAGLLLLRPAWAADLPQDLRITRVVGFDLPTRRRKFIGKNSRRDDHGDRSLDRMVRLFTNAGLEGLGNCAASQEAVAALLGRSLGELYDTEHHQVRAALGSGTMPVWDLAGKVLNKPVYQLLGGAGLERVRAYDGSIYFVDLIPAHAGNYLDRFKEELDEGLRAGHRSFKIKIGRGARWMEAEAGYERDRAVLEAIRRHVGADITLGVDANNGYDLARTKRLLDDLPGFNFAFVEEMFPEELGPCLELKAFLRARGWPTLVADGETQSSLEVFKPFIEARAIDVLQGNMNRFGFEGILEKARLAAPAGIQVAPHNWGSLVGFYMQLHVGRAIPNFYMAEQDPLQSDLLRADGYELKDGTCRVPEAAGFGLKLDEARFAAEAKIRFDLRV